ncbi:MAG TPA: hypothetical protein VFP84_35785, partial [Kofleriaceae bacterium]|nr:hypothetical protein [Kofleriaceae bacterium]
VWNAEARRAYLAAGGDARSAQDDVGWFDSYAQTLERGYRGACGRASPAVIRCLDGALGDLGAALTRDERALWPRLRSIERCGARWHERDLGAIEAQEIELLSFDRTQLLVPLTAQPSAIRALDSLTRQPVDLAWPIGWRPDGTIVGTTADDELAIVDPRTRARRGLGKVHDHVRAVSPDLAWIAVDARDQLAIEPVGGGAPALPPLAHPAANFGGFSPDGRRFVAATEGPLPYELIVDDLGAKRRTRIPYRVQVRGVGDLPIRWLDADHVLLDGGAGAQLGGDVWRLAIGPRGELVGPPEVWIAGERGVAVMLNDVRDATVLATRILIGSHHVVLDRAPHKLPTAGNLVYAVDIDRRHHRALVAANVLGTRWAWLALDGARVQAVASLDGLVGAAVAPRGLAAIDVRRDPPAFVQLDDDGGAPTRIALPEARGHAPSVRCATSRCVAAWRDGDAAEAIALDFDRAGRITRGAARRFADGRRVDGTRNSWDLSPDGRWLAAVGQDDPGVVRFDLARGTTDRVACGPGFGLQKVKYRPDGDFVISGFRTNRFAADWAVLLQCDRAGHTTVVSRGDQWISSALPIDDHQILINYLSYNQNQLLFESQPVDAGRD